MHYKTSLALGLAIAMGSSANAYSAIVDSSFNGWMTYLDPNGTSVVLNADHDPQSSMQGNRTPITGTLSYDTASGTGTATIQPFSFTGSGFIVTNNLTVQAIGDGAGGAGPLLLGNWTNDWNGTFGTSRSIVWDASGFLDALQVGVSTSDAITGGSLAATESFLFGPSKSLYTLPMGPGPIVSTTWNTTTIGIGEPSLGTNPSGTLPLIDDGIGGSPDANGPTDGFNFNLDITDMHVTSVSAVPVPAAVWLFGSGLLGLIGVAKRKKA